MSQTDVGPGSLALTRITARLMGWITLLTAPAWVHGALDQAAAMSTWWNALAGAVMGIFATAVLISAIRPTGARWPAIGLSGGVGILVALWPWGVADPSLTATRLPWLWLALPLAMAAVASLDSLLSSVTYGAAVAGLYARSRIGPVGGDGTIAVVAVEFGFLLVLSVALALLARASRAAARDLDADARRAVAASIEAAGLAATADARAEVDGVLHDRVLAALLLAVRSPSSPDVSLLARQALASLADSGATTSQGATVAFDDLRERIESGVRVVAPKAHVVAGKGRPVPEAVARAVVEATAEVVRNSVRHASRDGHPATVEVRIGARGAADGEMTEPRPSVGDVLTVDICDDGEGFDPLDVPPERLGLAVSVVGRMRQAGGAAVVNAAPGQGVRVALSWPEPVPVTEAAR